MATVFGVGLAKHGTSDEENVLIQLKAIPQIKELLIIAAGCIALGGTLSFMWLLVVRKFARQLVYITLFPSVALWLGLGLVFFAYGQLLLGFFLLVIAGLHALFYYWWRHRIPFAVAMLKTISDRIQDFPATAYTAYFGLGITMVWIVFWTWTVSVVQNINGGGVSYFVAFFLLLSFYWSIQVIKNVVHVTVSGVFATWYFFSGTLGIPANPTVKSFKRAMTTSFGSICLGSLLVALLQTLRAIARSIRNDKGNSNAVIAIIACLADCILGCLDSLLQYFNIYAFAQVAIYGKSYCRAAKDTWDLISTHGVFAIINDNLISGVLTMGAFIGAAACGMVAALIAFATIPDYWVVSALLGFLIGFTMVLLTMEVVQSGVATIFVCFAMDPLALKRNDPYLYETFRQTYGEWTDLFV
jgi:hypothetical protein